MASHEWIYWQIYADQKRGGQLFTHLRRRRRNRRRWGVRDGLGQLTHRHSWTRRPSVVEQRSPIGDWELDTLRASYRKAVVASMTERRSRLHLLAYSPDGTAENVRNAIVQRLYGLGHTVHTLTADNGKEFDDHQLIAACLQSDFYFADPYCAWQRGSKKCQRVDSPVLATTDRFQHASPMRTCDGSSSDSTIAHARYSDSKLPSKSSPRRSSTALRIRVEFAGRIDGTGASSKAWINPGP